MTYFKRVILPGILFGLVMVLLLAGAIHYGFLPENMQRDIYEKHGLGPRPEGLESPSPKAPEALPKADTARLEQGLSSRAKKEQAATLVPALRKGEWDPDKVLPEGTRLTLKPETLARAKNSEYTVQAKATGTKEASFLVYLAKQDGKWLITHTKRTDQMSEPNTTTQLKSTATSGVSVQLGGSRLLTKEDTTCASGFGARVPVLMVHGLHSDLDMWASMRKVIEKIEGVRTDSFDYKEVNSEWVTHPDIAPKLAERINCLAAVSRSGGGRGKVVVVAHSMGGLATRLAASRGNVADNLGLVITMGTPHLGSGYGNLCYLGRIADGRCQGSAPTALSEGSRELRELPEFPRNLPVRAIAGHVTASFNLIFASYHRDMEGDKVVSVASATKYYTQTGWGDGRRVYTCFGTSVWPDNDASCEHNVMVDTPYIQQGVTDGIREYLAASKKALEPTPSLPSLPPHTKAKLFGKLTLPYLKTWGGAMSEPGVAENIVDYTYCTGDMASVANCPHIRLYDLDADSSWLRESFGNKPAESTVAQTCGQTASFAEVSAKKSTALIGGKSAVFYSDITCFDGSKPREYVWYVPEKRVLIHAHNGRSKLDLKGVQAALANVSWS